MARGPRPCVSCRLPPLRLLRSLDQRPRLCTVHCRLEGLREKIQEDLGKYQQKSLPFRMTWKFGQRARGGTCLRVLLKQIAETLEMLAAYRPSLATSWGLKVLRSGYPLPTVRGIDERLREELVAEESNRILEASAAHQIRQEPEPPAPTEAS